jgi:hypothetical protein
MPGKPAAHPDRGRRTRPPLHLELLEDRWLLSTYTPGPLTLISNPDPLAGYRFGFLGANVAAEPYVAVNPANPQNIAAIWIEHGFAGIAVSATLDGGTTWQNESLPGITSGTGGNYASGADPWLTFAPNGDLYAEADAFGPGKGKGAVFSNKSTDGGLTWSDPIQLDPNGNAQPNRGGDRPSLTADPTHPGYVYTAWTEAGFSGTIFTRTVDGGQTWEPDRSIHTAPPNDLDTGHQIVVLPNGTLVCAFTEGQYNTTTGQVALTLLRSTDQGQTWSGPITAVVQQPLVEPNLVPPNNHVTDPDTGQLVESHPFASIAVDPHSGNLYAVWVDAHFSNFQYNSIGFAMSSDGGLTWSNPIQVNQTPNSVPTLDRQALNPTVAVAADGTVAVSYFDFRNNTPAPGALADYWMAFCRPSATRSATNPGNWGEIRLTDTSFDLEQAPTRFYGAFFLGDYDGLAAVGNDLVAVWSMPDGTSTSQDSVFFRRAISGGAPARPRSRTVGAAEVGTALLSLALGTSPGFDTHTLARVVGPSPLNQPLLTAGQPSASPILVNGGGGDARPTRTTVDRPVSAAVHLRAADHWFTYLDEDPLASVLADRWVVRPAD